ncbi:MAG: branched-chain amino acid ABC transporter permease [Candidatus Dormibacteraeota bacterium]|uniref:Branched-chain amino acid ABC transporter permease n=1 Tax=Candidatus Amunia macphersoniae TaxID=3127014 RepID=A0A934NK00_9BACT|nr:branched-chain amino acid ABC transporter permease [Candidatus Dormibacteraeota bacterium]
MHQALQTLGFGIVAAAILALSALAFTLEYSVTNVANLSHGEILTVGAYSAYLVQNAGGGPILAGLAAAGGGGALALAVHTGIVDRFVRKGIGALPTFIATLGVSLVIQNVLVIIFGASNLGYKIPQGKPRDIGPFLWTDTEIEIIVSAVAITALLYVIIQHTRFGKSLRAVSQNRSLASVSGINAHRVSALTWLLAGLIAGYAGFILAESIGTFSPYSGFTFFLITLTAAVAGGLGKALGTLVGGIIVGIILEFVGGYISASYNLAFAFAILSVVILVRPRGLFVGGRRSVFE